MFVSPISNFSVSNAYRNNNSQSIKNNQQAPVMQSQLNADTVSFGAKKAQQHKHNKLNPKTAILAAAIAAAPVACTPDYESYTSLENNTTINLKDYHKCGCDSFPIIIPGGKDTVYIPVPGETVHDTIYIEKPGETVHDTIYIEKPGETVHDTIYIEKPGEIVRDTIYIENPPDTVVVEKPVYDTIYVDKPVYDTIYVDRPVYDTVYVDRPVYDTVYIDRPVHDTIWIKPDTVYIPRKPHFEINDSINKDIEDFEIPTEGDGDFVYAFQGRNEYLGAQHLLVFNGFFSNEHKSSFIDHAFEEDDIPAGGNKPSKYYYTRYDISSDYENGRRYVEMYVPRESRHVLPDDKKTGSAGWEYAGSFYVKNASVGETAKLIANDMNGTIKAQFTKNEHRGPGNIYKEWPLDDGSMPKTTIENVKAYRKDLDDLD